MDDTVGEVQERVGAVARDSGTVEELDRRLRDGESYTLMLLDASADDIRKTKPFPSTAVTALRSDEERVTLEVFSTGHGSRQTGWFGEESVNLVGCALVSAEPGGRTSVRGTRCSTAVQDVFREPWEEVRLRP